jgi:nucleoside 2-deoxyribosyltransferase
MRRLASVYLSGPGRWAPEGQAVIARQRQLCEAAGVAVKGPGEAQLTEQDGSEAMVRELYAMALASLREADAVIADLTPWRGPSAHPTAIFETGFASAIGKPVFAYLNIGDEDDAEYAERVGATVGVEVGEDGVLRDADGALVEDFGLPESLMLWAEARRFFCVVTADPFGDVTGVELCLKAMKAYAA